MDFQTPIVNLQGSINATVKDTTGTNPENIIEAGKPWTVEIEWEMTGTNWQLVSGKWHVHVNLDAIGHQFEQSLEDFTDPSCMNQTFPNATGKYSCKFDVPGNVLSKAVVPHQGMALKMVVVLTCVDNLGHRGPIAALWEGPIILAFETP